MQHELFQKKATYDAHTLKKKVINYFGSVFRLGDKVMHIKNNYDLKWHSNRTGERGRGIFNGEIGNIVFVSKADDVLAVEYTGGRVARYSKSEFKEIQPAYAITVHKSQGTHNYKI